ncbi:MAG: cryptochrome/photolyase family protein [Planctomycetes bacterium]|nr:cryptochrome/photolyase family protein [Planctomycetota bacterium]
MPRSSKSSKAATASSNSVRRLVFVLGDQLDHASPLLKDLDPNHDLVCMAEVVEEATHVWCHKSRLVFFFSAMRHFAQELQERGLRVWYHSLTENAKQDQVHSLAEAVEWVSRNFKPQKIEILEPGDLRVHRQLKSIAAQIDTPVHFESDPHYYLTQAEFRTWAKDRAHFVLEHFYRFMRKRFQVLLDEDGGPVGGSWNYDSDNRKSFGKAGPGKISPTKDFALDSVTQDVIDMVESRFHNHPGTTVDFDLPVTRAEALAALRDFIAHRLPKFGEFQDAMWLGAEELNHSRLSPMLNVHLLNPREVVQAAIEALDLGKASLNSVEGFVRQILGWREFVRGIYWHFAPKYEALNFFNAHCELPKFYWDGETEMPCVADAMRLVRDKAYAHHIQRLMVLGLLAQLIGVDPYKFHLWHMAMYADAIDWVSLPNTLGMSQFGDGGIVGTKPYCASGAYIDRMSNYCGKCRYNPKEAVGPKACPFTTLYWDFLSRNLEQLKDNQRLKFQLSALEKKTPELLQQVRQEANELRRKWGVGTIQPTPSKSQ